jgi:uncharacterized protein involved in response to NO
MAARAWRNLVMTIPVTVLGLANLLMHLEALGVAIPAGLGWRLGLMATLVLISVISGRITPTFTRNWLVKQQATTLPAPAGRTDKLALAVLHTSLLAWVFLPDMRVIGAALLVAAALNAWRLMRWRGAAALAEPLLTILHVGYLWLVLGTAFLGLAALQWAVPLSAAIHALTVGAIGTMIVAVMTRATRGHSGRDLVADRTTVLIYVLVNAAAIARIVAALAIGPVSLLLTISAGFWILSFLLFCLRYGPMLLGSAPR